MHSGTLRLDCGELKVVTSLATQLPLEPKGETPFMRNRCITYAASIYVNFSTFNALTYCGGSVQEACYFNNII